MLAAARVLQGLGGGGLMTLSQALIGEAVPPRERARYQGFLSTVAVSSSAFGAIAGGLLTAHFGWRSIFLIGVPIGLLAIVLLRKLPVRAPAGGTLRFDAPGLALFAIFITSSLTMLNQVHNLGPEVVLPVAGLLALCAGVFLLLVWWKSGRPIRFSRYRCFATRRSGGATRWPCATARCWCRW